MKKDWSKSWIRSTQTRKQRKYRMNAPFHIARKFLSAPLAKDLRAKYKQRSVPVRSGDKVKILRGEFKGKTGKVEKVSLIYKKIYVENVHTLKRDGSKAPRALEASNVMITELNLDDKKRKEVLERS